MSSRADSTPSSQRLANKRPVMAGRLSISRTETPSRHCQMVRLCTHTRRLGQFRLSIRTALSFFLSPMASLRDISRMDGRRWSIQMGPGRPCFPIRLRRSYFQTVLCRRLISMETRESSMEENDWSQSRMFLSKIP